MRASEAFKRLISRHEFNTVLDIGSGDGEHAFEFQKNGKKVFAVDLGKSIYYQSRRCNLIAPIEGDFNKIEFDKKFDCVWASHVLEHQVDPGHFLRKVKSLLNDNGVFAVTVPLLKHEIVGGHVTLWNTGLLIYNMILAGFDCSKAECGNYLGETSVIVKKSLVSEEVLSTLHQDAGDIIRLSKYFPFPVVEGFDGLTCNANW